MPANPHPCARAVYPHTPRRDVMAPQQAATFRIVKLTPPGLPLCSCSCVVPALRDTLSPWGTSTCYCDYEQTRSSACRSEGREPGHAVGTSPWGGSTRNLKEGRYQTKEQGSIVPKPTGLKPQGRPKLQEQSADAESWDQT